MHYEKYALRFISNSSKNLFLISCSPLLLTAFLVKISGHRSFWDFLREYSIEVYQSIRLQNTHADSLTEKERLFIIMMIDGQMSLLKQLVKGKVTLDREEFADLLCSIMPDSYKAILEKDPVG